MQSTLVLPPSREQIAPCELDGSDPPISRRTMQERIDFCLYIQECSLADDKANLSLLESEDVPVNEDDRIFKFDDEPHGNNPGAQEGKRNYLRFN